MGVLPYPESVERTDFMLDTQANNIYLILQDECNAPPYSKDDFILWATDPGRTGNEFRFCGVFGMAVKVWITREKIYVTGMNEEEMSHVSPHQSTYLDACLSIANARLAQLTLP